MRRACQSRKWSGTLTGLLSVGVIVSIAFSAAATDPFHPPAEHVRVKAKLLWHLRGHNRWVRDLAYAANGKLLISAGDDGQVLVWRLSRSANDAADPDVRKPNSVSLRPRTLRSYESPVTAVAVSPDSETLAIGTWDGNLESCKLDSGKVVGVFSGHRETITALHFHPSGDYLASGSADDRLILWDVGTGEDLLEFHQGNEYDVTTAAFNPAGTRIVTGDGENQLKIWDAETGDEVETLVGHSETVTCAAYSPNGTAIVSGAWDDSLLVWDVQSGKPLKRLLGHDGDVTDVWFARQDVIISASEDRTVRIWHLDSVEPIATLSLSQVPYAIAYNPERALLAVGGRQDCKVFQLSF